MGFDLEKVKPKGPLIGVPVGGQLVAPGGPAAPTPLISAGRLTPGAIAKGFARRPPAKKVLVGGAGIPVGQQRGALVRGGGATSSSAPLISMGGLGAITHGPLTPLKEMTMKRRNGSLDVFAANPQFFNVQVLPVQNGNGNGSTLELKQVPGATVPFDPTPIHPAFPAAFQHKPLKLIGERF